MMDKRDMERTIMGFFFIIANKLQAVGDIYMRKDNMTTKQWLLTNIIEQYEEESPILSEVAWEMNTSHQNAKLIALKLEKKGFLSIEKDNIDKRKLRLKLTKKSDNFWEKRGSQDSKLLSQLFSNLTDNEINSLCIIFPKVHNQIMKIYSALKDSKSTSKSK